MRSGFMMESSIKKNQTEVDEVYIKINDIINKLHASAQVTDLKTIAQFQSEIFDLLKKPIFLTRMRTVFSPEDLLLEYFNCTGKTFLTSDMQNKFEAAKKKTNAEFEIIPRLHNFFILTENVTIKNGFGDINNMSYKQIINLTPENDKKLYDLVCFAFYCGIPNMLFFYQYYTNGFFTLYDVRSNTVYFLKDELRHLFNKQEKIKYEDLNIETSNRNYKPLEIAIKPNDLDAAIQNAQISDELKEEVNSCIKSATDALTLKQAPSFLKFTKDYLPVYISTKDGITHENLIQFHLSLQQSLQELKAIYGPNQLYEENELIRIVNSVATTFKQFILDHIEITKNQAAIDNYISSNEFTIPLANEKSLEILKYTSVRTLKSICHFYNNLKTADEKNNYVQYLEAILGLSVTREQNIFEKYFQTRASFSHIAVILVENFSLANLYLKNKTLPRNQDTILGLCKYTALCPNEIIDISKLDFYKNKATFLNRFLSANELSELSFYEFHQQHKSNIDTCVNYLSKAQIIPNQLCKIYTTIYDNIDHIDNENAIKIALANALAPNPEFISKYQFTIERENESTPNLISDVILSALSKYDNYRPNLIKNFPQLSNKALEFILSIRSLAETKNLFHEITSDETKLNIFNLICNNENTLSMLTYDSLMHILSLPLKLASKTLDEINESPEILSALNLYHAPRDESSTFINKTNLIARSQATENPATPQKNSIELEQ